MSTFQVTGDDFVYGTGGRALNTPRINLLMHSISELDRGLVSSFDIVTRNSLVALMA